MTAHLRSPKQLRSEATLERIVESAQRLYGERGTTQISVRELCDRADASPSSLYARFTGLEAVVRVAYDRFSAQALGVIDQVDAIWVPDSGGSDDFPAFVHRVISDYANYFEMEQKQVQAFRSAERDDPELVERRVSLDREILERCIRCACRHYPRFEPAALEADLNRGLALVAAAARGAFDFSDQLSLAPAGSRDALITQLVELVLGLIEGNEAPADPSRLSPTASSAGA